jgi:hypothetical protein
MKKIYIYSLFIIALSTVFASCQKDELYRPGSADTQLNAEPNQPSTPIIVPPIVDNDEDGDDGKG